MGFRDLECFNKAMLAKQCWRLIQEPDYLIANKLDTLWKQAPVVGLVMGVMSIYGRWLGHSAPSKVFSPIKKLDCEATMSSKDGCFSVRSAYRMEKSRELAEKGQASRSNQFEEVWKQIWQLNVQPSDKVLLWRTCLEALPTQSNLLKKKVVDHPLCPICCMAEENVIHALWRYEYAKNVWSQCSKKLQKCYLPRSFMLELFDAVLNSMETQEGRVILDMLAKEDLNRSNMSKQLCSATANWKAPPLNWFKLNWDGSVDKMQGFIRVGVAVRDSAGQIIATMRLRKHLFPNPLLVEAYGVLQAIKFGLDLGLSYVIIEGDSLQVINALHKDKEDWSSASMFMCEAKQVMTNFAK
ncbi:uncharacterized protein LOC121258659 [Juglans microcarpa x Juglans regia]|uniref:uncharacterized protein LOC121258659 n=1 Tax=Juglans microcarpa x Juglans regia TaxID=2249226 RepID=UPI001B7F2F22|nr:uncharacterized protein LOC121258659 [Juglans microcarpa x Juglans regia]